MHPSKDARRSGALDARACDKSPLSRATVRVHDSSHLHMSVAERRVDTGISNHNSPLTGFACNVARSSTAARLSQTQLALGDSAFRVELSVALDGGSRVASEECGTRRTRDAERTVLGAVGEGILGAVLTVLNRAPLALRRAVADHRPIEGRHAALRDRCVQRRSRKG